MASAVKVVVTGNREIDRALKRLENKVRNKAVRKASRNAAKKSLADYKQLVPVASGSMRDAAVVRGLRKTKSTRGALGASVIIDRKKLFTFYEARTGRPPGKRKADSEPFFYPTVVEFGLDSKAPESPLRKSVFGNADAIRKIFLNELRILLQTAP